MKTLGQESQHEISEVEKAHFLRFAKFKTSTEPEFIDFVRI